MPADPDECARRDVEHCTSGTPDTHQLPDINETILKSNILRMNLTQKEQDTTEQNWVVTQTIFKSRRSQVSYAGTGRLNMVDTSVRDCTTTCNFSYDIL